MEGAEGEAGKGDLASMLPCILCRAPCSAERVSARPGTDACMCIMCFRAVCNAEIGQGDERAQVGDGDSEGGSDAAALDRAAHDDATGRALEGWESPGSSLVDVGESAGGGSSPSHDDGASERRDHM